MAKQITIHRMSIESLALSVIASAVLVENLFAGNLRNQTETRISLPPCPQEYALVVAGEERKRLRNH
ncbi:MAG: hypothetical protein DMF00_01235 [Verrucomicrobia bacterium]|nr:MAG: hypothetical protein DMF00_01235 [Verrucomicrobiota bacterium]